MSTGVTSGVASVGKGDWRTKHADLQKAMKMARKVAKHERDGTLDELGPIEADPSQHVGLIPCPHCGRTFNPEAAVRHIRVCQTIQNKPRPPPRADGTGGIRRRGLGGGAAGAYRMREDPGRAGGLGPAPDPLAGIDLSHHTRGEWGLRGPAGGAGGGGRPHTSAGPSGTMRSGGGYGQARRLGARDGGGRDGSGGRGLHADLKGDVVLPGISHPGADVTRLRAGGKGPVVSARTASSFPTTSPVMMRSVTAGGPGSQRGRGGGMSRDAALLEADLRGDPDGAMPGVRSMGEPGSLHSALLAADAALVAATTAFAHQAPRGGLNSASTIAGRAGIALDALREAQRNLRVAMQDVGVDVGEDMSGHAPVTSVANASSWVRQSTGRSIPIGARTRASTGAVDVPEPAPMLRRPTAPSGGGVSGLRPSHPGRSARTYDDGSQRFGVSTVAGGFSGAPQSNLQRPGTSGSMRSGLASSASFRSHQPRFLESDGMQGRLDNRFSEIGRGMDNATSALSPLATGVQLEFARTRG